MGDLGRGLFYIYRNLTKGGYSVRKYMPRERRTGVICVTDEAWLLCVSFKVNMGGFRRARRTGHRNVHAFAAGAILALPGSDEFYRITEQMKGFNRWKVFYDPFGAPHFFVGEQHLTQALAAHFTPKGLYVYCPRAQG